MLVNSSEQDPLIDAHGRSTAPYCKYFTTPRSVAGSKKVKNIPLQPMLVPFLTFSSQRIKVSLALTLKYRHIAWYCMDTNKQWRCAMVAAIVRIRTTN